MDNKRSYSKEEYIRVELEKMRREEPIKFFFMMIKKEIQYLVRHLKQ